MCGKSIIAMYSQDAAFPVYCRECWFSDAWDPLAYGREYDFTKNFFEQVADLINAVPQISLQVSNSVNSEYINQAFNCKNCYLVTSASDSEDSLYANRVLYSKNVCECMAVYKVENSYEARESRESSNLTYCDDCHKCFDMSFCYDARNSNDCFMSSGLRSKSHIWYGQRLTANEFRGKLTQINCGSYANVKKLVAEYEHLKTIGITRYSQQRNAVSCTGNIIANAKNCRNCFYASEIENANNVLFVDNAKDIYDANNGCCSMERIYEVNTCGVHCYDVRFSSDVWPEVRTTTYSLSCRNDVHDLFACVGLRKKSFCILNKQYVPAEYAALMQKIVQHMNDVPYVDKRGLAYRFGEFFPPELSPFTFNESAAYTYTPLKKSEVIEKGWRWKEQEPRTHSATIFAKNLPDDIQDAPDSITQEIIACEHKGECNQQCVGAFRIIPDELAYYRKKRLALPRLCPNCRHYERVKNMAGCRLYSRNCMCDGVGSWGGAYKNKSVHIHGGGPCSDAFKTSYAPNRPEIIYCEQCYNVEVV